MLTTTKQKKTLISAIGLGASAILIGTLGQLGFTERFEGMIFRGYLDPIGIPTKCAGDTYNVELGKRYTEAECRESLEQGLLKHSEPVLKCAPELKSNEFFLAAAVDHSYHLGPANFCGSGIEKAFERGEYAKACKLFNTKSDGVTPAWVYVKAGKDSLGNWKYKTLPGLIKRAAARRELCEKGL